MPVARADTSRSISVPGVTGMGELVQVGEPKTAAFPPLPVADALFAPSLPPSLQEDEPAPVLLPDHASGDPLPLSKEPFLTWLPWTLRVTVLELLVSKRSAT